TGVPPTVPVGRGCPPFEPDRRRIGARPAPRQPTMPARIPRRSSNDPLGPSVNSTYLPDCSIVKRCDVPRHRESDEYVPANSGALCRPEPTATEIAIAAATAAPTAR